MLMPIITSVVGPSAYQSQIDALQIDALRYAGLTYVMKRIEAAGLIGTPINSKLDYQLDGYWKEYLNICKNAGFMLDAGLKISYNQGSIVLDWQPFQKNISFINCPVCNNLVESIDDHCKLLNDSEHSVLLVHQS